MMLNISDSTLTKLILEHLVEQAEGGGLDQLLANGIRPELVDDLRQRPLRDFFYASRHGGLAMSVQIDIKGLEACLWRRDIAKQAEILKEYYIRNGASLELLRTFFTLSKQELHRLRTELAVMRGGPNGRPRMPPAAIRDKIHVTWHKFVTTHPGTPDRERLMYLHQEYQAFSITALHRVITEFDGEAMSAVAAPTPAVTDIAVRVAAPSIPITRS